MQLKSLTKTSTKVYVPLMLPVLDNLSTQMLKQECSKIVIKLNCPLVNVTSCIQLSTQYA